MVVLVVELLHRIAEERTDLVLGVVLSHQLGLLLARSRENRTHSRRYLCETRFRCRLRRTRLPVFLFVRKYTSLCSHTFLLILSMSAIGLIFAIVLKFGLMVNNICYVLGTLGPSFFSMFISRHSIPAFYVCFSGCHPAFIVHSALIFERVSSFCIFLRTALD